MKIFARTIIPFFLAATLASCNSFMSTPRTSAADTMETAISTVSTAFAGTQRAIPTATPISLPTLSFPTTAPTSPSPLSASPTPLLFTDPSIPMLERIVYYYFVTTAENPLPEGSIVVAPAAYTLAPTYSDAIYSPDTAADLRTALEAVLHDARNGWISSNVEIIEVTFHNGGTNVILEGEYFGVGDVTLIAARMQILMTVFANPSVQTATITLNGDTIGNLGVSISTNAKSSDYTFTRAEIETFMKEHAYVSP